MAAFPGISLALVAFFVAAGGVGFGATLSGALRGLAPLAQGRERAGADSAQPDIPHPNQTAPNTPRSSQCQ